MYVPHSMKVSVTHVRDSLLFCETFFRNVQHGLQNRAMSSLEDQVEPETMILSRESQPLMRRKIIAPSLSGSVWACLSADHSLSVVFVAASESLLVADHVFAAGLASASSGPPSPPQHFHHPPRHFVQSAARSAHGPSAPLFSSLTPSPPPFISPFIFGGPMHHLQLPFSCRPRSAS